MCTVTYLPTANYNFLLTSNRDERSSRKPASFPAVSQASTGDQTVFPKDGEAGGTWIACSASLTICLLNGAFQAHLSQPPYRLIRGLVVLAAFNYPNVNDFIANYDLDGIEPFTMLLLSHSINDLILLELRWDSKNKFVTQKDVKQPHIWSSVTLYTPAIVQRREAWFTQWLASQEEFTVEGIRKFHHFGGEGDRAFDLKMNRADIVSTLSITTVACFSSQIDMHYEDTQSNDIITYTLPRKNVYIAHLP